MARGVSQVLGVIVLCASCGQSGAPPAADNSYRVPSTLSVLDWHLCGPNPRLSIARSAQLSVAGAQKLGLVYLVNGNALALETGIAPNEWERDAIAIGIGLGQDGPTVDAIGVHIWSHSGDYWLTRIEGSVEYYCAGGEILNVSVWIDAFDAGLPRSFTRQYKIDLRAKESSSALTRWVAEQRGHPEILNAPSGKH